MTVLVFDIEADNLLPNLTKCHCLAIKEMTNDGIELYADVGGYRPITEGLTADSLEQTSSWLTTASGMTAQRSFNFMETSPISHVQKSTTLWLPLVSIIKKNVDTLYAHLEKN